jgi:hypothetical protein
MIPTDKKLYAIVKAEADKRFLAPTSAYKSAWIVREYKKRGGEFEGQPDPKSGLLRWFKEKWVDVNRPGQPCGRAKASEKGVYPLCRPTVKVTKETPVLKQELSIAELAKANKEKQKVKSKGSVRLKN